MARFTAAVLVVLVAGCVLPALAAEDRTAEEVEGCGTADERAGSGTIVGRVLFEGEIPKSPTADHDGQFPELLHVDSKHRGLQFAVAFLDLTGEQVERIGSLRQDAVQPAASTRSPPAASIDQVDYAFVPRLIAVRAGEPVAFTNSDPANHNVRAASLIAENQFNVYTGSGGEYRHAFRADAKYRPVLVGCDIHAWMRAWVYVFDHPYFAVTDAEGAFRISGVPPGQYRLIVRQPDGGLHAQRDVTVRDDQPAEVELEFHDADVRVR